MTSPEVRLRFFEVTLGQEQSSQEALGLGGFAIALALKDTITNIFSGLVIMISRPFAIGDRVDVPVGKDHDIPGCGGVQALLDQIADFAFE